MNKVKQYLPVLILLCGVIGYTQIINSGRKQHGIVGITSGGGVFNPASDSTIKGWWTNSIDGGLNPTARWWDASRNLLLWSEDLTNVAWTGFTNASATDADTVTTTNATAYFYQTLPAVVAGVSYTVSFESRAGTLLAPVFAVHCPSPSGYLLANTAYTPGAGTWASVSGTFTATACAAPRLYPLNGSTGIGTLDLRRIQVNPGLSIPYAKTESRQRVWDWSVNAAHLIVGPTSNVETNDPTDYVANNVIQSMRGNYDGIDDNNNAVVSLPGPWSIFLILNPRDPTLRGVLRNGLSKPAISLNASGKIAVGYSRNLLAVGSSQDLTNVAWSATTGLVVTDANTVTRSDAGYVPIQQVFTGIATPYTASVTVSNPNSTPWVALALNNSVGKYATCWFNTSSGAVSTILNATYSAPACSSISLGSGRYRLQLSSILDSGSTRMVVFLADSDGGTSGQAADSVDLDNLQLELGSSATTFSIPGAVATATNAVAQNQWHVATVTHDNGLFNHYLDGTPNGSVTGVLPYPITNLQIGTDGTNFFDGGIIGPMIFNRKLTDAEVLSQYNLIKAEIGVPRVLGLP